MLTVDQPSGCSDAVAQPWHNSAEIGLSVHSISQLQAAKARKVMLVVPGYVGRFMAWGLPD